MRCKRCFNQKEIYFYLGSKGYYCRKCSNFKRLLLEEELIVNDYNVNKNADYQLPFILTDNQLKISESLLENLINGNDVVLNCVCGAGKTEITLKAISYYLKKGLKVCFAISRKEVVVQLHQRFSNYFKDLKVIKLYGGNCKEVYGDLIICTCHQLYRYYKYFDLLILDEVDAFPFKNNDVLFNIALNSCKGRVVYSSATIEQDLKAKFKINTVELRLNKRPHNYNLIVPKLFWLPKFISLIIIFLILLKTKEKWLVFLSTKNKTLKFYQFFKYFIKCNYITSSSLNKELIIDKFEQNKINILFTTSILERGVTFENVNVMVFESDDDIFDVSSLTQIAGRVGRSKNYPFGKVYFFFDFINKEIIEVKNTIINRNLD